MPKANAGLRLFQWGLEGDATPGTAVAATSKMAVSDILFTPIDAYFRPQLAKGLMLANPGDETVIVRGTQFAIPETPVIYDEFHKILAMSVVGDVAATGADPYLWTFTRNPLADPDVNTRTLERRLTDGTNHIDNEWAYAFLSEFTLNYRADQPLMYSCEGFARRIQGSTLTAAQAFPTIEIPAAALAKVWIDATWANLGTTLISAQVLSAQLRFASGYRPKMSLDGRTDLDFTMNILNAREVKVELTIRLLIEASAGQYATEKTAAEAGTLRAVRIKIEGTQSRYLQADMLLKHDAASLGPIGEEDGQDIVEMKLVGSTDATNFFSAIVQNKVGTVT